MTGNDYESQRDAIEALCDEFEALLQSDPTADIRPFVQECDPRLRDGLLPELVLLDIDYAYRLRGEFDPQAYRQRYPEFLNSIEIAFAIVTPSPDSMTAAIEKFAKLEPNRVFSHFRLLEHLDDGATGTVWKASDTMVDRIVALKIPDWARQSTGERLRFLREGRTLSRLGHEGIVVLHEMNRDGALPYLALEYAAGGTLAVRVRDKPLLAGEAALVCQQVANAVEHAHRRGVVHRDLKPENVLLRLDGGPLLIDFGLSRDANDGSHLTEHGEILGTFGYMPPEQAGGRALEADERSDVYGIGAVLYTCLTGERPYLGQAAEVLQALADESRTPTRPRVLNPKTPKALEGICLKALEKRPENRYATAGELADDLGRWMNGQPIVAKVPSLMMRSIHRHRRTALAWLLLAAAGALIAAAVPEGASQELRKVEVSTKPQGARVAFVPLGERGDRPRRGDAVFGSGSGPIRARLTPGNYLVVAVLPDGRFHEVYRRIPAAEEELDVAGRYQLTRVSSQGVLRLQAIDIPDTAVLDSMVLVEGIDRYVPGRQSASTALGRGFPVAAFYMDSLELGVSDTDPLPSWTGTYHDAIDAAERSGKRLPTELEYEFAATARGASRFPWGDRFPQRVDANDYAGFKHTPFDRCNLGEAIYGLCSGVAEWMAPDGRLDPSRPSGYQVVRGGDRGTIDGNPAVTLSSRDPLHREYIPSMTRAPGLGFRGVRSAKPMFGYEAIR